MRAEKHFFTTVGQLLIFGKFLILYSDCFQNNGWAVNSQVTIQINSCSVTNTVSCFGQSSLNHIHCRVIYLYKVTSPYRVHLSMQSIYIIVAVQFVLWYNLFLNQFIIFQTSTIFLEPEQYFLN